MRDSNLPTKPLLFLVCLIIGYHPGLSQGKTTWAPDGNSYFKVENNELVQYALPSLGKSVVASQADLVPKGQHESLAIKGFSLSKDGSKVLVYTNSKKVWRQETRGDYWLLDKETGNLKKLGVPFPPSTLMFAKLSPKGGLAAYVSGNNLYTEDLSTGKITALTNDGTRKLINGTFDWAYEEEFGCRDGFQWSEDGERIAFWQVDATKIPDYNMIDLVDSVYSQIKPVEYPTAGQDPSPAKIGVVEVRTGKTTWMDLPGDPRQHYVPVMAWVSSGQIIVQQLNRKQNESQLFLCEVASGLSKRFYSEKDNAWVSIYSHDFHFITGQKDFLWTSEKDGWRHLYRVSLSGEEKLLTPGNYDAISVAQVDTQNQVVYFLASPENATQQYLYKIKLDGKGKLEMVSPVNQKGTHSYSLSPQAKFAEHTFSNTHTKPITELIALPGHRPLDKNLSVDAQMMDAQVKTNVSFFTIKTEDNVEMDGWMVKPNGFDPGKKYPVVFFVYSEPASATVRDAFGTGINRLYRGNMAEDGYIYISVDNRGTPAPKGREWRKSIYRKIGVLNIEDQAKAAREILKWKFMDTARVAVWGWSGGGSATLNLLFQHPEIYKTGIAIAAVANQLTYDNIYQERYMGLPQENREDFIKGSPITHAKGLEGNLLYIHGTGDDNVHYNNAEMLVNELVKYNKQFQFMAYPNRTHSISEGEGTFEHLSTLYTTYLRQHCPPGGKSAAQQD